jgi:hypothetical protein
MPVANPSSIIGICFHTIFFPIHLSLFVTYAAFYFLLFRHLPLPAAVRKLLLWCLMGVSGMWWADLQLDGVKRGSLSQQPRSRVPRAGSIIAANFTSPIDALYLVTIFDPIFVSSHPLSRKVRRISLFSAICAALSRSPQLSDLATWETNNAGNLTDFRALLARHPGRVIAVFPECGTTNGKGVLPLSPCLLAVPAENPIFPVSMRYTPPDVTTPVPGAKALAIFLWKLLGTSPHTIRVRLAEAVFNTSGASNGVSHTEAQTGAPRGGWEGRAEDQPTAEEQKLLDRVAEALARLGRVKRVGLTLKEKKAFVKAWTEKK